MRRSNTFWDIYKGVFGLVPFFVCMFSNHAALENKPKRVGQLDVDAESRYRVRAYPIRSCDVYEWTGEWRDGGC